MGPPGPPVMERSATQPVEQEDTLLRLEMLTEQVRRLEAELHHSQRLATLGMLAGSIAHEFNNILTPVLSYAQMALATPEDTSLTAKALQKAVDGTEKAAHIASSMLGFIREEEGPPRSAVRDVVHETLRCLGRDLSKDGIAVDIDVPRGTLVAMRPIALEQVLMNLILNAVEAMRPGTGRLRISARPDLSSTVPAPPYLFDAGSGASAEPRQRGGYVLIDIEDSGRGISPDVVGRIFEPLFTRREGRRGTGLGLSICQRLVEEARGTIAVHSVLGEGSTFTVRIPAAE